jgi:hypothetical protein
VSHPDPPISTVLAWVNLYTCTSSATEMGATCWVWIRHYHTITVTVTAKSVHIVTNLSKEASPSPLLDESPATGTGPLQSVPHYCVSEACTNELDAQGAPTRLQIAPANAASSSLVHHEAAQTATTVASGEEDTSMGGNGCTYYQHSYSMQHLETHKYRYICW